MNKEVAKILHLMEVFSTILQLLLCLSLQTLSYEFYTYGHNLQFLFRLWKTFGTEQKGIQQSDS